MLLQTVGCGGQLERTCRLAALDDDLCQTVEGGDAECAAVLVLGVVGTKIGRVAVAHTEDAAIAFQAEGQHGTGIGDDAAFLILHLNGYYGYVAPIGSNGLAVGLQHELRGGLGGLDGLGGIVIDEGRKIIYR